jgi:diguanylate cyclase (GGDEF)-like protein
VKADNGQVTHYVGTMIDITARKADELRIAHLAHYDMLTDLPNRTMLLDRLHQALAQARRDQHMLALMFLDLDKFKIVNDKLGHEVGDLLLKKVALRMQACVKRESDTVSRIGGDEFVVLLPHIEHENDAVMVAEKLLLALNRPFVIGSETIQIGSSIGIAIYPHHANDAEELMKNSDAAMYQAKIDGRNRFRFYQP